MEELFLKLYRIDNLYNEEFSKKISTHAGDVYYDIKNPNKYLTNYLDLSDSYDIHSINWYIEESKKNYKSFAVFKCINYKSELFKDSDIIKLKHLIAKNVKIDSSNNYIIKKIDDSNYLDMMKVFYLEYKDANEEFANTNAKRFYDVIVKHKSKIDYYFIYNGNVPVGYLSAFLYDGILKLENFGVSKKYQGLGYGKALFKYVVSLYKYDYLYVLTEENSNAIEIYKSWGFIEAGESYLIRKLY